MEVIDGIRCISHFHVVAFHVLFLISLVMDKQSYYKLFYSNEFAYVAHGSQSMNYFFLITGFLITNMLLNQKQKGERISVVAFVIKRLRRLYPALLASVLVFWMLPLRWIDEHNMCRNKFDTWRVLLLAEPLQLILPVEWKLCGPTWNVGVQMMFYLMAPFLVSFLWKRKPWLQLVITSALIGLVLYIRYWTIDYANLNNSALLYNDPHKLLKDQIVVHDMMKYLYLPPWTRMDSIFVGVFVALLNFHYRAGVARLVNNWAVAIIGHLFAILIVILYPNIPLSPGSEVPPEAKDPTFLLYLFTFYEVVPAIGMAFWLLCGLSASQDGRHVIWPNKIAANFFSLKIWQKLAKFTYCGYLFHCMVAFAVIDTLRWTNSASEVYVLIAVIFVVEMLVGMLAYYLIELPFTERSKTKRE